jgi:integrase
MSRRSLGEVEDARKRAPKVRLGKRILAHLRRWQRLDGPNVRYLCHYNGCRVKKLRRSFPLAAKKAGLVGVTPHTLRHTRATWLMQDGVPIWEAAGALGMTTDMLERTYGHHHPDWQKRAAEV